MPAELIDGKAIAADLRAEIKILGKQLMDEKKVLPGLATVLVGDRPDSATYVRMKHKAIAEVEFHSVDVTLPATVTEAELLEKIDSLNADDAVHGILVQLPLPDHISERTVLNRIHFAKDVDGFLAENIGQLALKGGKPSALSCTPAGCIELIKRSGVEISGKNCVVVGRSNIVGMPVGLMLMHNNGIFSLTSLKDFFARVNHALCFKST
jgi:5,10-methylene-tetrahydrofolate dehydrogenase/methenyl tetrahydrofolate cyclohydrolase